MALKYFKRSEFNCKCGCNTNYINDGFLEMIDNARRIAGLPFIVNSGYRCEKHPLSISNPTSSHTKGIAADIRFTNGNNLALILGGLGGAGFERFGIDFENKFIHADCDTEKTTPCIWGY
tara:strand:- start:504 stop:863 length:360 start_codon:yes stop_codon:yes gene_type:complete